MTQSNAPPAERTEPVKPAVEARQGVISGRVVTVLVVSVTLSILALAASWAIFGY